MIELIIILNVAGLVLFSAFSIYLILIGAQECYECGAMLSGNFMLNEDGKRVCSLMCGTKLGGSDE